MSVAERDCLVKSSNRCFNCLGLSHSSKTCRSPNRCNRCKGMHHSLLHVDRERTDIVEPRVGKVLESTVPIDTDVTAINCATRGGIASALLPTAVVDVIMDGDIRVKCRVLLDSGSQASFVTDNFVKKIDFKVFKNRVPVHVMSSNQSIYSKDWTRLLLASRYESKKQCPIVVHVFDRLTGDLPGSNLCLKSGRLLHNRFQLADPEFEKSSGIDVILGADNFFGIIGKSKYHIKKYDLYVIESRFGWVVSGGSHSASQTELDSAHCSVDIATYDKLINRFWDIDDAPSNSAMSEADIDCENLYRKTTVRAECGRYSVDLPFKMPRPKLGESYDRALQRFYGLERKFKRDPELKTEYINLMTLFQSSGYVEPVPAINLSQPVDLRFYLPHYAVTVRKIDETLKIRIVFDASMMSDNGTSLNDVLLTGPNLQLNLLNLLTKFSLYRYVFSADITKMFRQIAINESCRDYQRIIWRERDDEPLKHYRLTTVVDGMTCSPFLALRTLQKIMEDECERYPMGSKAMEYRYMDDFFVGDNDLEELKIKKHELIRILESAGMRLSKWASNNAEITGGMSSKSEVLFSDSPIVKTLGVLWNTSEDCFRFCIPKYKGDTHTKRSLLCESAGIFDPAGWISPVTVRIKALFQKTWVQKLDWDTPISDELKASWLRIRDELPLLNELEFKRWIGSGNRYFFHGFCDASLLAYGAVIYCKIISSDGGVKVRLICSKTKVAPLKPITIARLELCGAHLLSKLMKMIIPIFEEYDMRIQCWSDSTTVLAWLASPPSRWASFVANRCGAIHELLPNVNWRYIKTDDNPADLVSRGLYPSQFIRCHEWCAGPEWLKDFDEIAPDSSPYTSTEDEKKCTIHANLVVAQSFVESFILRFSSLNRLRRTFAYMRRLIGRKSKRKSGELTVEEIDIAFQQLLKAWQFERFKKEIDLLRNNRPLESRSRVLRLSPFIHEDLLRVGGRLENAELSFHQKHPIILEKSHLVDLIVQFIHIRYYHAGAQLVCSIFRSHFFAYRLRSIVKHCIRNCQICLRLSAKTYQPVMGQLPHFRFISEKPFFNSGVDFAGPLTVRPHLGRGKMTVKGYICVFVCLFSRAVHLELVHGLDTNSLILALKRFISRRGYCSNMYSDNAKNFVGCARVITKLKEDIVVKMKSAEVRQFLSDNLMNWHFIPPQSPTFGGIWEASVKSIKFHLYRALIGKTPTIEELTTFLCEIECILNSRPICPMSEDPEDFDILTPAHLITGHPLLYVPLCGADTGESSNDCPVSRYRYLKRAIHSFWRVWRNEFYGSQMKISKWYGKGEGSQPGDLVLIKRKHEDPCTWARGRIVKLYPGGDCVSRVVDVLTEKGITREMVRNLVPLVLRPEASAGGKCSEESGEV